MGRFVDQLKRRAKQLKIEAYALYYACQDPRVPWYARFFVACMTLLQKGQHAIFVRRKWE
jgi:uncharacterized membrane protein YkvA (DUF1232 family)